MDKMKPTKVNEARVLRMLEGDSVKITITSGGVEETILEQVMPSGLSLNEGLIVLSGTLA